MCGINGGWLAQKLEEMQIVTALNTMKHRGPDDFGLIQHNTAFIGMRRLSIIDLKSGHQPIFNEDESVAVVFNGEIYNYRELIPDLQERGHILRTKSDTEVLVHLYEEYGTEMCKYLRGMFSFAILDKRRQSIFVARDRFGKKPLYYMRTQSGGLLFASEIKGVSALAKTVGESLTISPQSIYDYLSLGVAPQPTTIFENIFALPAGSWMRFDGGELQIQAYWLPNYTEDVTISYKDAAEQLQQLIAEAVRIRLRSDVPLGVLLSGGIDSTIVAYEAAQELGKNLQTFTVSVNDEALDESPVAQRTAQQFDIQNIILPLKINPLESLEYLVRQYDQPFSDPSAIPSLEISRLARQHVKVVLNGDGGDELFAGYRRHIAANQTERFQWVPIQAASLVAKGLHMLAPNRRSILGHGARFARSLSFTEGERYLVRTGDMLLESDKCSIWKRGHMRSTESWVESVPTYSTTELGTQLGRDIQINLLSVLLVKMDIATMAASLEGRSPLMDHVVAEFAMRLPLHYHVQGLTTKALLRDAYRGRIPDEVISGAKRGFEIPLVSWLQNDFKSVLMDTLSPSSARVRSFVADDYVDQLLAGKIMQDRNWGYLVYSLLILELWLREFDQ